MNKEQFITSLRKELKKLPPEEIVAATEYYEEYFAEAAPLTGEGEEAATAQAAAEAKLIEEIGSPKAVAAQIKSEYASRVLSGDETLKEKPTVGHKISALWWILLGVLAAPVALPIAIALLVVLFAVVISFFAVSVAVLVGGIAAVVFGIISLATAFSTGLMFLGGGLALVALAVLIGIALIALVKLLAKAPGRVARKSNKNGGSDHE